MSPEQKRKFNLVAGSSFLAMGIVTWALTAYFAITPNPPRPTPVVLASVVDLTSCRSALSNLGYQATMDQEKLTVSAYESFAEDSKAQLDKVTMSMGLCKMDLHEFCMGEACTNPGLSFTLKRPELAEAARKAAAEAASARRNATRASGAAAGAVAGAAAGAAANKAVSAAKKPAAKPNAKSNAKPAAKQPPKPARKPAN